MQRKKKNLMFLYNDNIDSQESMTNKMAHE